MNKTVIAAAITTLAAIATAHPATATTAPDVPEEAGVVAMFEGESFDLSEGWGSPDARSEIQACHATGTGVDCFRSVAEMDAAVGAGPGSARMASCSSSLRLYDGASHSGAVLSLSQRGSIISLASYGFDNRTSSYRVGACSATFYNGIGSSPYPGNTSAYATASTMYSGWNNTISSVYLS